jgi:hypothetical protein
MKKFLTWPWNGDSDPQNLTEEGKKIRKFMGREEDTMGNESRDHSLKREERVQLSGSGENWKTRLLWVQDVAGNVFSPGR